MNGQTETLPTLAELNEIQRQWMALDPSDHSPHRDKVLNLMKKYPRLHLTVSGDGQSFNAVLDGMPFFARAQTWDTIRAFVDNGNFPPGVRAQYRPDVAWCGSRGEWVSVSQYYATGYGATVPES